MPLVTTSIDQTKLEWTEAEGTGVAIIDNAGNTLVSYIFYDVDGIPIMRTDLNVAQLTFLRDSLTDLIDAATPIAN